MMNAIEQIPIERYHEIIEAFHKTGMELKDIAAFTKLDIEIIYEIIQQESRNISESLTLNAMPIHWWKGGDKVNYNKIFNLGIEQIPLGI